MVIRSLTCVVAKSYSWPSVTLSLVRPTKRIAWSLGFAFVNVGGAGRSIGSCPWAWEMAAWTSVAAASRLFDSPNWSTKLV
jgi:hypothetical protein